MAKNKFKTAKSRDFPHVCIKREKLGLLPSYVMTLSFLARPKKKQLDMPHALHAPRAGAFNIPKYQTYPTSVSQVLPSQQCRNMSKL